MEVTPDSVATAVNNVATIRGHGTLSNVLAFGRALKELGVKVSLSQIIDAARSLDLVDIGLKSDFRALLRSNLISQKEDFPIFDMAFDYFWREQSYERVPMETLDIGLKSDFRALLRSNLISQKEDFPIFDMAFDYFWREQSYERVPMETLD